MFNVDTSDWNRLANEYQKRINNIESNPFGAERSRVHEGIKGLFRELLERHEGVSLPEQLKYYGETSSGYYGSGHKGHDPKKINPQEWIGGSARSHIKGTGSFFASSTIREEGTGSGNMTFNLETGARMQPYPRRKPDDMSWKKFFLQLAINENQFPYSLPEMPIMHYFRNGWVNPQNPNHHMMKRPFGEWLARSAGGLGRRLLASYNSMLLKAAGFRGGAA